jgi:1-pyrroline-5-carboxylate dehydrogenase
MGDPHDMDAITTVPEPFNEPVRQYAPGTAERAELESALADVATHPVDLPHVIGGHRVTGAGEAIDVVQPHAHSEVLGTLRNATHDDARAAIDAANEAAPAWRALSFDDRAAILLKAAELSRRALAARMNAATMLGQSKTPHQAEIDAACELIDFWRFNVHFARELSGRAAAAQLPGVWNRMDTAARGLRLRGHALQLHGHRRQPADGPR